MPQTPNERFLVEFNAVKLLTMALTKVILDNSGDSEQSANKLIGMIKSHISAQKVEGMDVKETEALRREISQRVESLINAMKTKPTYRR